MKTETTRRAIIAGLAAVPVIGLPAVAGDAGARSIGAAMEHHKLAYAAFENISDVWGDTLRNDPNFGAIDAEWWRLNEAEKQAMDAVCKYPVRTLADAQAKAKYLIAHLKGGEIIKAGEITERQYLAVLEAFLV